MILAYKIQKEQKKLFPIYTERQNKHHCNLYFMYVFKELLYSLEPCNLWHSILAENDIIYLPEVCKYKVIINCMCI